MLSAGTILCAGPNSVPAYGQQPDIPCTRALNSNDAPAPTAEQRDYRNRLHSLATGAGVRVAIIDTGIGHHEQLPPVDAGADFVAPDSPDPRFDCDLHGTIVAGIIASREIGIAPDVTLISVRQSSAHYRNNQSGEDATGQGSLETLAKAIEDALNHHANIINISVVSCVRPDVAARVDSRLLDAALARAEAEGAIVVAAAGNKSATCEPGMVVYPAHSATVVAVGALDDPYSPAPYSIPVPGTHAGVAVSAPGRMPLGLAPAGSGTHDPGTPATGWARGTRASTEQEFVGTSFAAPIVSGTAALLRQRFPQATAAQLREHIAKAAQPASGALDPLAAVSAEPADHQAGQRGVAFARTDEDAELHQAHTRASWLAGGLTAGAAAAVIAAALRRPSGRGQDRTARARRTNAQSPGAGRTNRQSRASRKPSCHRTFRQKLPR